MKQAPPPLQFNEARLQFSTDSIAAKQRRITLISNYERRIEALQAYTHNLL